MSGLKIVTIGGGSSYTPELIDGFIKRSNTIPLKEIWLVDILQGKEKLEIVGNLAKRMLEKAGLDVKVHLTLDRTEALKNADFVTTQFRVGFLKAREFDERIPLSHGMLGQETNGAGGMFKAFRTIPIILEIVEEMKVLCPNAFLINFTNPSGILTEAVSRYSSFDRMLGLCNLPLNMKKNIAKDLNVEECRLNINFAGINHFIQALDVYLDGKKITEKVLENFCKQEENLVKNVANKKYDLGFIKSLGVLICPYHNYYFKKDEMLKEQLENFKTGTVRAQNVEKLEKELFEIYKNPDLNTKPKQLEGRGGAYYSDSACQLIESLYNDKRDIQVVDIRNNGSIHGIDDDCAVEVSSVITNKGAIPLNIGKLPTAINGIIMHLKAFEKLTIEAAIEGDYNKALTALITNPLTSNDETAKIVLDELFEAHRQYLPRFFK